MTTRLNDVTAIAAKAGKNSRSMITQRPDTHPRVAFNLKRKLPVDRILAVP